MPRQLRPDTPTGNTESPDHSKRWSRPALKRELDNLPDGHPSSSRRADEPDEPGAPDPPRDPDSRLTYWDRVPEFEKAWAEHETRWPADRRALAVDRSGDPPGSWRGDGNQYLGPGQHAEAKDLVAGVRRAERPVTADLERAERDSTRGGHLEGLEFRLKGEERLKEKIAERIEHVPGTTPAEAMRGISDAIRYTFCFEPDGYAGGYHEVRGRLEASGHRMTYAKNHWRGDPEYKGVNTRWVTPGGQRFELQFHTPESVHAKQEVTHASYERLRNPLTTDTERGELESFQRTVSSCIAVPDGVASIPDYKEGR